MKEVIAVFDIGKTNKKFLCDDIENLERWIKNCLSSAIQEKKFSVKAVNFTTYGASLMYVDKAGKRLTPVYNYLKPMPDGILDGFYDKYGGLSEFSRKTTSPAMGMLNSGLQALWLKKARQDLFQKVDSILHFPQYLSFLFTQRIVSEYTSIGCHTALWDFDAKKYHPWTIDESLNLPDPLSNSMIFPVEFEGQKIDFGIGIHDSSSSMVPYIKGSDEKFILISTGTWCITMNPFNEEPLTREQLEKDTLCYMSIRQEPVKSSRLFLGHIHDVNVARLTGFFNVEPEQYKKVKTDKGKIAALFGQNSGKVFFINGMPFDFIDKDADLSLFSSFDEAYHKLMYDLVGLLVESVKLVLAKDDQTKTVYISGGFARNEIFVRLIAAYLPELNVFISEMDNATALGAAMVILEKVFDGERPDICLGLKRIIND